MNVRVRAKKRGSLETLSESEGLFMLTLISEVIKK